MKKISLVAAVVMAAASSSALQADPFKGGYAGVVGGFKATTIGKFDTGVALKPSTKKKGLTGGLSLGWGGEVAPNFYLGLHIDFLLGSGSKKVETKGQIEASDQAYVPFNPNANGVGGGHGNYNRDPGSHDALVLGLPGGSAEGNNALRAGAYIIWASEDALASGAPDGYGGDAPLPLGPYAGVDGHLAYDCSAIIAKDVVNVTQTISVKDRSTITPLIQAGYVFKAALAGKDVLVYGEVGPHFAFTKLSVETRATDANLYRIAASNDAFAYAVARDPILEKRQKSSVDVGIALGTGAKVAVSKNMFMSLGYRFTKVRGQKELKENKVKIPSQSHTILWGLVYSW